MVVKLAAIGYVIVAQLVASHPLHGVLEEYDRGIAALRRTQDLPGLRNPVASAAQGALGVMHTAASGAERAQAMGGGDPEVDLQREDAALAALARGQRSAAPAMERSTAELATETSTNLRGYSASLEQRSSRAYAARAQQLRENELTLAFDLARRDAGRRLALQLRLDELHLTAKERAALQTQLAALNAAESRAIAAMRRNDAGELAAYAGDLRRDARTANVQMDDRLRATSVASYAILRQVFGEQTGGRGLDLQSQLTRLHEAYAPGQSARAIAGAMRQAGDDLAARFAQAGSVDATSQRDVAAQLRGLKANRDALYRSIVAEIRAAAAEVARERHLAGAELVSAPRPGLVDLTGAVARQLHDRWR
jgi:hypothetical protein